MMRKTKCQFCRRPATLLCDFQLGIDVDLKKIHTCDAPICAGCATRVGTWFECGSHCDRDTVDLCPDHVDERNQDVLRKNVEGDKPITAKEAESRRQRNRVRRMKWRLLPKG